MTQVQDVRRAKVETGKILPLALGCAAVSVGCVAIPMFVIRPFRPQGAEELEFALTVRHVGPWLAGVGAAVVLLLIVRFWKNARVGLRISLAGLFVLATVGAVLARIEHVERGQVAPAVAFDQRREIEQMDRDRRDHPRPRRRRRQPDQRHQKE